MYLLLCLGFYLECSYTTEYALAEFDFIVLQSLAVHSVNCYSFFLVFLHFLANVVVFYVTFWFGFL